MTLYWRSKFKHHLREHGDRIMLFREHREFEDNMPNLNRIVYHDAPGVWAWSHEVWNGHNWIMEKCSEKWNYEGFWDEG